MALSRRNPLARSAPHLTLLALCLACTHARTAADAQQAEQQAQRAEDDTDGASNAESADPSDSEAKSGARDEPRAGGASGQQSDTKEKSESRERTANGEKKDGEQKDDEQVDPEDIEVATSPQGLLEPGALDKVRDKLGVPKGQSVQSAVRRFQREHDLPATGMLDHETVERLGLSPDEIFEQ